MANRTYYFKDRKNNIYVYCPKCGIEQELLIDKNWYDIDRNGVVFPDFVCMEPSRKCNYSAQIELINWKG